MNDNAGTSGAIIDRNNGGTSVLNNLKNNSKKADKDLGKGSGVKRNQVEAVEDHVVVRRSNGGKILSEQ